MTLLCNMKVTNYSIYPCVMGIINVTPDSFYSASRVQDESLLRQRVRQIVDEGGRMIDVGAYSSRPGADEVSIEEELGRLRWAMPVIIDALGKDKEKILISVDTFRASVAECCVTELGADIINDISGGTLDEEMFDVVARTRAPYILMHMRGNPQDMQSKTSYDMSITQVVKEYFEERLALLTERYRTLNGPDSSPTVILDPGYGFAKTLDQNYELMQGLPELIKAYPESPMLVGISRKSMIYRLLDTDADHALNGTTVLNTYALLQGAHILRVHDVKEAVEALHIVSKLR